MVQIKPGLRSQRTTEIIHSFVDRCGSGHPRRAIFCTFDLDIKRFESVVLPELTRRGRQFRTLVFADAARLQAHLKIARLDRLGRFQLAPVACKGSGIFHPKLIFLQAGSQYLIGVGSANLTSGGLGENLEMMLFEQSDSISGKNLLNGACHFLRSLLSSPDIRLPSAARDFVEYALAGTPRGPSAILNSLDAPLAEQMANIARRVNSPTSMTLLSPWHSAAAGAEDVDASVLKHVKTTLGLSQVSVYTEGKEGFGPKLGRNIPVFIRRREAPPKRISKDSAEADDIAFQRRPTRLHAKAYLMKNPKKGNVLFFGSANCTHPGLTLPLGKGGNVELLVATALSNTDVQLLRVDLDELFTFTTQSADTWRPEPPLKAGGSILAGEISETRGATILRLESKLINGTVFISDRDGSKQIRVTVANGQGVVQSEAEIKQLFGDELPTKTGEFWGAVLWEVVGKSFVPFPITVPLVSGKADAPDEVLTSMAFEELGGWPAKKKKSGTTPPTEEEEVPSPDDDKDLQGLAEANHQGRLDRLAVAVAILRKRSLGKGVSPEYSRQRLALLREKILKLDIAPHLQRVLCSYLSSRPISK